MKLTGRGEKLEKQMLAEVEKIARRVAKKTGDDVWYVKSCITFLLEHQKRSDEVLSEESMQRAHDAVWGEGR